MKQFTGISADITVSVSVYVEFHKLLHLHKHFCLSAVICPDWTAPEATEAVHGGFVSFLTVLVTMLQPVGLLTLVLCVVCTFWVVCPQWEYIYAHAPTHTHTPTRAAAPPEKSLIRDAHLHMWLSRLHGSPLHDTLSPTCSHHQSDFI